MVDDSISGDPDAVKKNLSSRCIAALSAAARSWYVFPCKRLDKTPYTPHGFKDATTDSDQIQRWWAKWPDASIGIDCERSGLVVIDIDPRHGGDRSLAQLEQRYDVPVTYSVLTGGKGTHLYFTADQPVPSSQGKIAAGVDVKSRGGYVIAAGSGHESGQEYRVVRLVPLVRLPDWLRTLCTQQQRRQKRLDSTITEGARNDTLASLAGVLRRKGASEEAILVALKIENTKRCEPPLPEQEVQQIAASIAQYAPEITLAPLTDEEENQRMLRLEQEPFEARREFPCPSILWQGVYGMAANILGAKSWEIWLGITVGLAARAHRSIHVKYYGNLFGMFYGLLLKPTGGGKRICTDVCEHMLPDWYLRRRNVQSGPALATLLAEIEREKKSGKVLSIAPRPAALVIPEWSILAKNLKIQHSTLAEDLNEIFDGPSQWNVTRSDRPGSGGGDLSIPNPSLCICGTTTESMFRQVVTVEMIRSGFMNRYLILPGSLTRWKLYDEDAARIDATLLRQIELANGHCFGNGNSLWSCYEPAARDLFLSWGRPLFEGLMNGDDADLEIYKRLHTYAHKICLLYAWSSDATAITVAHVEAAQAVIDTSLAYLRHLLATPQAMDPPAHIQYVISAKERIYDKIKKGCGTIDLRKLYQDFRRTMTSADIRRSVEELLAEERITKGDRYFVITGA